jgi:nicotinamidase-related amidase
MPNKGGKKKPHMRPPVEFLDRGKYKTAMNDLLEIDPRRTAVLTVDMQREYLDLEVGSSPVAGDEADRVLQHARQLLDFVRAEGLPVVHVYVSRRPVELDRGLSGPKPAASRRHRVSQNVQTEVRDLPDRLAGSPQAEVPAQLLHPNDLHVTTKKSLDGFLDTDLDLLLRRVLQVDTLVLTGINTDTCVYSTTFAASNRGYAPIVISDCVASMRGKDAHWMALELMSRSIAWVLTVEQFKQKVRSRIELPVPV